MRLVNLDAVIDCLELEWGYEGMREDLYSLPVVDAVPVVRCKDCRYWQDNNGGYPNKECRWREDETPDADDFCSCGERKENDDELEESKEETNG